MASNEKKSRNKEIVSKFKQGQTLASIGLDYGISRQAVQILVKRCKLDRTKGGYFGSAKRVKERASHKKELNREHTEHMNNKYGMDYKKVRKIQKEFNDPTQPTLTNPTYIFFRKQQNAINALIEWDLTFGEWWNLWEKSKKWKERGRKSHEYVLGRKNKAEGFTIENSSIMTNSQNIANRIYKDR